MGIMVYSLFWVMQDVYHRPKHAWHNTKGSLHSGRDPNFRPRFRTVPALTTSLACKLGLVKAFHVYKLYVYIYVYLYICNIHCACVCIYIYMYRYAHA